MSYEGSHLATGETLDEAIVHRVIFYIRLFHRMTWVCGKEYNLHLWKVFLQNTIYLNEKYNHVCLSLIDASDNKHQAIYLWSTTD